MAIRPRRIILALLILLLLAVFASWLLMRGSVAKLDGTLTLPGLSAPVVVKRDHLGNKPPRVARLPT